MAPQQSTAAPNEHAPRQSEVAAVLQASQSSFVTYRIKLSQANFAAQLKPPMGHCRPTLPVSRAARCLLFPESDLITARQRSDAKGQKARLPRPPQSCQLKD